MTNQLNFIAIDFETANRERSSACAIGLAFVKGGKIVDTYYSLIKPEPGYFIPEFIDIHGIRPEDVATASTMKELWPVIEPMLQSQTLVAHNAPFDQEVLCASLKAHGLKCPDYTFICSRNLSKRTWPGRDSYSLGKMAPAMGITFNHHDALEDARACAELTLKACQKQGARSMLDIN